MRETPRTICDQCAKDLSTTAYESEYRAVITAEPMPGWGGVVYATSRRPPVKFDHHFCDMVCLAAWVSAAYPDAAEKFAKKQALTAQPA